MKCDFILLINNVGLPSTEIENYIEVIDNFFNEENYEGNMNITGTLRVDTIETNNLNILTSNNLNITKIIENAYMLLLKIIILIQLKL